MKTVRIEHRGRRVWHFPVVEMRVGPRGVTPVERYRVVLGDDADAQLSGEDVNEPGRMRKIPNEATVPADAWESGWEPTTKQEIYLPAPVVTMTVEQFCEEVFPVGSFNRDVLDKLEETGDVRLVESHRDSIARGDKAFETARENAKLEAETRPEA